MHSLVPAFFLLCPLFFSGAELHFVFCFFLFPFLACLSELTEMLQQEKFHTVERNRSYLQVLCSHFYSFHLFHCNFLFILNVKNYFKGDLRVVDHWKGELVYNFSNKMISFFPFFLLITTISPSKKETEHVFLFFFIDYDETWESWLVQMQWMFCKGSLWLRQFEINPGLSRPLGVSGPDYNSQKLYFKSWLETKLG